MKPYNKSEGAKPGFDQKIPAKLESMISAVLKYIEATEKERLEEKRFYL